MIWTLFGRLFDATMGQMLTMLGGPRPGNQGSPWNAMSPPAQPALPPAPGAGASAGAFPVPAPRQPAAWQQPAASSTTVVVVERQESRTLSPRDLDDDAIQLVKYALVSIRRCHEKVLTGGVILVTTPMTAAGFATWIVAMYLQSPEYQAAVAQDRRNEITHADKKYLRVSYGVLKRWPRTPSSGCGRGKSDSLEGIRNALLGLRRPLLLSPAPQPSAARGPVAAIAPPPAYEPAPGPAVVAPTAEPTPAVTVPPRRPRPPRKAAPPVAEAPPSPGGSGAGAPPVGPRRGNRPPGPPRRRPR